jgi:hypothetical protein
LIEQNMNDHPRQYMLMWVKDGIIYALTGPGSGRTGLRIAESLQ